MAFSSVPTLVTTCVGRATKIALPAVRTLREGYPPVSVAQGRRTFGTRPSLPEPEWKPIPSVTQSRAQTGGCDLLFELWGTAQCAGLRIQEQDLEAHYAARLGYSTS